MDTDEQYLWACWADGRFAWEKGYTRDECPYDGTEREWWKRGYDARQQEMMQAVEND